MAPNTRPVSSSVAPATTATLAPPALQPPGQRPDPAGVVALDRQPREHLLGAGLQLLRRHRRGPGVARPLRRAERGTGHGRGDGLVMLGGRDGTGVSASAASASAGPAALPGRRRRRAGEPLGGGGLGVRARRSGRSTGCTTPPPAAAARRRTGSAERDRRLAVVAVAGRVQVGLGHLAHRPWLSASRCPGLTPTASSSSLRACTDRFQARARAARSRSAVRAVSAAPLRVEPLVVVHHGALAPGLQPELERAHPPHRTPAPGAGRGHRRPGHPLQALAAAVAGDRQPQPGPPGRPAVRLVHPHRHQVGVAGEVGVVGEVDRGHVTTVAEVTGLVTGVRTDQ